VPHLEPEDLGLLAIGEETDAEQSAHLAGCPACRDELEQLRGAVRIGRVTATEDRLVQPPPRVWSAIHDELGLQGVPRVLEADRSEPAPPSDPPPPAAIPLRPRRRRALVLGLVAAAVVALVAGLVLPRVLGPAQPQVIAEARLAPLPGWAGATGSAVLERLPDGGRALRLRVTTPGVGHDYRELWLIDPKTNALVSLGVVAGGTGTFAVPDDLDLGAYDLVDVSREHPDGNPAHSGTSILRGTLDS
jgi:hypothetical protein